MYLSSSTRTLKMKEKGSYFKEKRNCFKPMQRLNQVQIFPKTATKMIISVPALMITIKNLRVLLNTALKAVLYPTAITWIHPNKNISFWTMNLKLHTTD